MYCQILIKRKNVRKRPTTVSRKKFKKCTELPKKFDECGDKFFKNFKFRETDCKFFRKIKNFKQRTEN